MVYVCLPSQMVNLLQTLLSEGEVQTHTMSCLYYNVFTLVEKNQHYTIIVFHTPFVFHTPLLLQVRFELWPLIFFVIVDWKWISEKLERLRDVRKHCGHSFPKGLDLNLCSFFQTSPPSHWGRDLVLMGVWFMPIYECSTGDSRPFWGFLILTRWAVEN